MAEKAFRRGLHRMETFADEAAAKPQRQGGSERSNPFESISRWTGLLRAEIGEDEAVGGSARRDLLCI
jgi:hypothetical protein